MDNRLRRRKKRVYFCFLLITAVLLFLYWPFDLSSSFSTTPKAKELRKEKDAVEPTKIETQERIVIKGSNTSLDNTQNDPPNLTPEIIVIKSAPPYVPVPRIRLKSVPEPPKNEVDDRKDVIHDMTSENTAPRKTPEIIIIKKANQELTAPPLATQEKIVIKSALPETPPVTKAHSKDEKESHNEEKNKKTSSDSNSGKSIGRDAKLDPESHEINENNDERFISVDNLPSFGWRYLFENQKRDTMIEVESLCFDEYNQPFFYTDTSVNNVNQTVDEFPSINLFASMTDSYFKIENYRSIEPNSPKIEYISDRVLFFIGTVWRDQLSHFFINNYMPLLNVFNHYYNTTQWLNIPRDICYRSKDGGRDFFDHGLSSLRIHTLIDRSEKESGLNAPRASPKKLNSHVRCYKRTVIGLNSTCACCGCQKRSYPKGSPVYKQTRELMYSQYLNKPPPSVAFELPIEIKIFQRTGSRLILNIDEVENYIKNILLLNCTVITIDHKLPVADQIRMMSTTTILISTHGNELGNALWLPDHSLVIEAQSFGRKGNLYFPVTFARGNESHPIYYRNISCYKSYDSNDKNSCRADSSTSLDQNFNLDVQELAEIIHSYVDYHKKMFLLGKESWEKLEIETNNYPLLLS